MKSDNFFAELKRRNVFRAAAFYAASAWLLVQVATQVFPFFGIANWLVRWVIVAAAIGFPFWVLFAWFYQWTPQGLQRERRRLVRCNQRRASLAGTSIVGSWQCWPWPWSCC